MIDKDSKIWCNFIDWDMYESMKALKDQEFQDFVHSLLKLQKTRIPQAFRFYITTPRRPLSHLLSKEINEEFTSFPTWETFWEEFKDAQSEKDREKRE